MTRILTLSDEALTQAAQMIAQNDIVVIPTETVYGLGGNALSDEAVLKIFKAKNRPAINPLIVHLAQVHQAQDYVQMSDKAHKLASHFWPGPLTMILPSKAQNGISQYVSAGLDTLAVRVPAHKAMRRIIELSGVPIAAPSANFSGEPSATTPQHAAQSLGESVSLILAAGLCEVGLESTVLDLTQDVPTLLRLGAITSEAIEQVIGKIAIDIKPMHTPKSPGQLLKHYAPSVPVRLRSVDIKQDEALLAFGSIKFMGIKGGGNVQNLPESAYRNLSESGDLEEAARNLFRMLRDLDRPEHAAIAVMDIPKVGIGQAINERLERAAAATLSLSPESE